jgi:hypothetical protein
VEWHIPLFAVKESFILVRNCVVGNNISYFIHISDFSDFVSISE